MNKTILLSTLLLGSFVLLGCVQNAQRQQGGGYNNHNNQPISANQPVVRSNNAINTSRTYSQGGNQAIKNSLSYMYDEERLAKEVYLAIYQRQPVQQLTKIASNAEGRHIDAVKDMAQRYGVATPYQQAGRYQHAHIQSLYNQLYRKGIRSQRDALEVGCTVEVVDVNDLKKYIREAQNANAQDVLEVYDFLLKGSYNHYWSFDKGLKQMGVSNGCCSLGQTYCHPEYPQNEKEGHGNGQGEGQGHGMGGGWR